MRKKLLSAIGGLFLLTCTFIIYNWQITSSLNSLKDITLKNIDISGKTYSLVNGKVYEGKKELHWFIPGEREKVSKVVALVGFYEWDKEDPLFDSPDLDTTELKRSVNYLSNQQNLLLKSFSQTIPIYPESFLNEFTKSASINKDFINKPSFERAFSLIKQQQKTAQLYEKDANTLKSEIPGPNQHIVSVQLQLNPKIVKDDITKISINGKSISEEIKKRENCLMGKTICERPALSFTKPSDNPPKTNTNPPDILSSDVSLNSIPRTPFTIASAPENSAPPMGPYSAKTSCLGWGDNFTQPTVYFYMKKAPSSTVYDVNNVYYFGISWATDVIFRKLSPTSVTEGEKELYAQGFKYVFNGTTSPYNCPDRTFFAEISELDLFLTTKKPVLEGLDLPDKSYASYEKAFFEQKYPSYESLSYLSDIYGYIYRQMVGNPNEEWVKKMLPHKEELLERSLDVKRKMGNLPFVLNSHSMFIKGLESRQAIEQKFSLKYIKEFVYTFRNFYGMTFLPFSPSVWRSNDNLEYSEKTYVKGTIGPGLEYITYRQAQKIYSQEEIDSWYTATQLLGTNYSYFRF